MSTNGDAHNNGDCWAPTCAICAYEDSIAPRLFVDTNSDGDLGVWERIPEHRSAPQPVLMQYDVGDEALWDAIIKLVESGGVA